MEVREIQVAGYEKIAHCTDEESGLNAIISIHDTTLGAALGGMRMLPYASFDEALTDVNRLAKAMTYKAAVAETGQGGGKAVILGDPARDKSEALFLAMGEFIESLGGRYLAAEDMNITVADLETVAKRTKWVTGLSKDSGSSGNPSPITALGCLVGMKASAKEAFGDASLKGLRITIQGVGAVGATLGKLCVEEGAEVFVCDIDDEKTRQFAETIGGTALDGADSCLDAECDIFSPCARGGILNGESVEKLRCRVVAGAANNQLQEPEDAARLAERGILYAPDYVINAGGIINIACEFDEGGYRESAARVRVGSIGRALETIYRIARAEGITTAVAADRLAEERLAQGRGLSSA